MVLFFAVPHARAYIVPEVHTVSQYHFNVPPGLESKVNFWKKVYTEYTTEYAIIHDLSDLDIIYEVVYFGDQPSRAAKERTVEGVKSRYRNILFKLAKAKDSDPLTEEESRVSRLVKSGFYQAASDLRVQLGQKDRFRTGLIRSGQYMEKIKKIFSQHGLPEELTVLPHVESSFQINAYSSAGAAGIWQFTRSTGKLFMKVGNEVDERLDPFQAADGAARLLKKNFEMLENWPLAITAYNHGPQGMKRAKLLHGPDIAQVIEHYKSRSFGFASQNFYAEFLAALDVVRNQSKYFPNLELDGPLQIVSVTLNDHVDIRTAMNHFGMTREDMVKYNPALRNPVLSGFKHIPKGYAFRAPLRDYPDDQSLYAKIPGQIRYVRQATFNHRWYTVKKKDNLSKIAEHFSVSLNDLQKANNLGENDSIHTGQKLQIPWPQSSSEPVARTIKVEIPRDRVVGENIKTLTYRVEKNDSLYKIAKRFDTNPQILRVINRIDNPGDLRPGQVLKVPNKEFVPGLKITKKEDHLAIESPNVSDQNQTPETEQNKPVEEPVVRTISLDLTQNKLPTPANLKNRPAFLPVAFANDRQKKSTIGTIIVDLDETLSHYAEWADLSLAELQRVNNARSTKGLRLRDKVKVPFYRVTPEVFEQRRHDHHNAIQEDFFNSYRVENTVVRKIVKGETIWEICNKASIPFWLLSLYNQDKNIAALAIGDPIVIPVVASNKTKES